MFKGFYNLTSGMLTHGRRLDTISNNMVNASTAGYKTDQFTASTFDEAIISRVGNTVKGGAVEIGRQSYLLAPSRMYTDYNQGALEETGLALNFAIEGDAFFAVRDGAGETVYTRCGDFTLDEEGYLCLPGAGQVLDPEGQPIQLMTDKISADGYGGLYTQTGGYLGQLGLFSFPDNEQLERDPRGMFTGEGAAAAENAVIHWKTLERSNVDLIRQMTEMITTQRALQSAAQVSKMYDQVMSKATTDLGRL